MAIRFLTADCHKNIGVLNICSFGMGVGPYVFWDVSLQPGEQVSAGCTCPFMPDLFE